MKDNFPNALLGLVIVLIILCMWSYSPGPWNHMDRMTSSHSKNLAQQLTDAGWVFYSKKGCPWCSKQLGEFPPHEQQYLNIVECSNNMMACNKAGVTGFPTWINTKTGKKDSGYKPKSVLANMV